MNKIVFPVLVIVIIAGCLSACSQVGELNDTVMTEGTILSKSISPETNQETMPSATLTLNAMVEPTIEVTPTSTPEVEPSATEASSFSAGETRLSEKDQMVQVYIPEGEITLGSNDKEAKVTLEGGRAYPEVPVNTVYLEDFWIDKYEVNNGQYALCVEAGICDEPYIPNSTTREEYYGNPEYDDYPVIWVTWYMATTYCEWADRRLPTEAEWEKASRGSFENKYPWGNEMIDGTRANFCDVNCPKSWANPIFDDGYADTAPVGSYPEGASPFGVMDMSGNVWEWTSTLVMDYPYDAEDGREDQESNGERVWRGGAWNDGYWWMRSSMRYRSVPNYWNFNLGFRCAVSD